MNDYLLLGEILIKLNNNRLSQRVKEVSRLCKTVIIRLEARLSLLEVNIPHWTRK